MNIRNNNLRYLKRKYTDDLTEKYGHKEADQLLTILIEHYFGYDRNGLALNPEARLSESEILSLHMAVKRLHKNEPVQYITGRVEFMDVILEVNPDVLIPRPETEYMVDMIIRREKAARMKVLDIGTGSGCIAIALAAGLDNADVTALDVSTDAIKIAGKNAAGNNQRVTFVEYDILNTEQQIDFQDKFDIIVSNPPYVTFADKLRMHSNVIDYEPHIALFVSDKEALKYYSAILDFSKGALKPGGRIYLEINENKGDEVRDMYQKSGLFEKVEVMEDIFGKDRFVFAYTKSEL